MARTKAARRGVTRPRTLRDSLRNFLTPALWKQAHSACPPRRRPPRWALQPLVLVLLCLTWAAGDSTAERFETAKGFVAACLPKRRRPGQSVQGFHKALARLPLPVLRAVAAGVRAALLRLLTPCWLVAGFVPLGCDGTRLECPRAEELERRLRQAGKPNSAPTLWLTALVHLRLGVPWAWRLGKGTASARGHLRYLLGVLPAAAPAPAGSAREVLLAIREELQAARPPRRAAFGARLAAARREQRRRRSAKEKRVWPRRAPHKPPKPPRLLTLGEEEKARILRHQTSLE